MIFIFVERLHDFLCEQIDKLTTDEMIDRQCLAILAMLLWKVCMVFFWVDRLSVFLVERLLDFVCGEVA